MIELYFVSHGFLGSLIYCLLRIDRTRVIDLLNIYITLMIGAISGYIYFLLYSNYSFPNALMSIVFGYFSRDILGSLFNKLRRLIK